MRHCLSSVHFMLHLMALVTAVLSYQIGGHFRRLALTPPAHLLKPSEATLSWKKHAVRIISHYFASICLVALHNCNWSRWPFLFLFGPENPNTVHAAARLQRWVLVISLRHTTIRLILVKRQHMPMQTACHISLYLRLGLPNVKRSSNIFWNLQL